MKAEQAVEQIRGMIFKPGWRFRASPYGSLVVADLIIDTVDSSHPSPSGKYPVPALGLYGGERVLDPASLDEAGVCAELLGLAAEKDSHENREFLRVLRNGRWVAPLHPHTPEGIANAARLGIKPS